LASAWRPALAAAAAAAAAAGSAAAALRRMVCAVDLAIGQHNGLAAFSTCSRWLVVRS
jgi:hypothetical protein